MKKILLVCLMVIFVISMFSVSACAQKAPVAETTGQETTAATTQAVTESVAETTAAKEKGKFTIGFVTIAFGDAYNEALMKGAKKGADEFGFELILENGEANAEVQDRLVRSLITKGVDAILLQAADPERLKPAVTAAYEANIPLIAVNMELGAPHAAYVGVDFWSQGRVHGEIVVEALDGKGTIINVSGDPGSSCTQGRDGGTEEVLKNYPDIKILDTQPAKWSREEALVITERLLKAYPDVDLITAGSVGEALGVMSALQEAGKLGKIKLTTYDLPKSLVENIKKGEVFGTAYDQPIEIAYTATVFANYILLTDYTKNVWTSTNSMVGDIPAWKNVFGKILKGSNKATVNNIGEVPDSDAF